LYAYNKNNKNHQKEKKGVRPQTSLNIKKMTMKISIQKRLYLGHDACYHVLELTSKTTKHVQIEIL
jgi:hypothetical protein